MSPHLQDRSGEIRGPVGCARSFKGESGPTCTHKMPIANYDDLVRCEWDMFLRNPERARATLEAVSELNVTRVLDLACGAGHELLPFVSRKGTLAIGLDISPEIGRAGPELINLTKPEAKV